MEGERSQAVAAWERGYAQLNQNQKRAVDTIEGPVMVIAGPGTGKTQILALRIANILRITDTAPEQVLALTFTEAAAANMRERLRRLLGSLAYRVPVFTFHAFSEHLIRTYPEQYERIVGGRLASDIERLAALEVIIEDPALRVLRPAGNPTLHLHEIARTLSDLKREAQSPDDVAALAATQEKLLVETPRLHEKGAHKGKLRSEYRDRETTLLRTRALTEVYRAYEAYLKAERLYDYDDMVLETIKALTTNEAMRLSVQETYQYVLADEHQDVNGAQNRILELLTEYHDQPNLFVVGDEKQAIFRFQGASITNFLHFEDVYGETTTIALLDNYRSGQEILDTAQRLIAVPDGPLALLRTPLVAATTTEATVTLSEYTQSAIEDEGLVSAVQEAVIRHGEEEVAVILRTNREVEAVTDLLRSRGIEVNPSADVDVLSHPVTSTVVSLLEAVIEPKNETALVTVLHGAYLGATRADVWRVLSLRAFDRPLAAVIADEALLQAGGVTDPTPFLKLTAVIDEARARSGLFAPHRILAYLVEASGLRDHITARDPRIGSRVLRRIYDEVESIVERDEGATLSSIIETLARYRRYGVSIATPMLQLKEKAVTVMTAHKAKGLEFAAVFIPRLIDATWGGRSRKSFFTLPILEQAEVADLVDDERRLLYVALTRAKQELHLSYATRTTDGKERSPSRLLEALELGAHRAEVAFDPLAIMSDYTLNTLDASVITNLLAERGLSVTAYNNYRRSPWTFVYRSLLRVPEVQSESLLFGNVVHGVLESITKQVGLGGQIPTVTEIRERIDRVLRVLPIDRLEYARLHERALTSIVPYVAERAAVWPSAMREEVKLSVRLTTGVPELPELTLKGSIDRLDFDTDGRAVRVVDYKTGKPKTRAFIEGTTKQSQGDYRTQLTFYALLLELHDDERWRTREGVISFVEPDVHGVIHEEYFTVTDEDIDRLRQDITTLVRAVVTGECLRVPCDPTRSDYCHLVSLLGDGLGR